MTKEDIYKKIEFEGKYDTKIKTNLRNLIKENKEDKKLLPLLLEVQNELETGKAKTIYNRMLKNETIEPQKEEKKEPKQDNPKKKYTPKDKTKKENTKNSDNSKKEKKEHNKKKEKKKKKSKGNIIAKIFIILFAILMIASSVSTIFSYFR